MDQGSAIYSKDQNSTHLHRQPQRLRSLQQASTQSLSLNPKTHQRLLKQREWLRKPRNTVVLPLLLLYRLRKPRHPNHQLERRSHRVRQRSLPPKMMLLQSLKSRRLLPRSHLNHPQSHAHPEHPRPRAPTPLPNRRLRPKQQR